MVGKQQPTSYYFGDHDFSKTGHPFKSILGWRDFLGSLLTASFAPDEGGPLYEQFECKARNVFDDFCVNEQIEISGMTELYLGQIAGI